MSSRAPLPAAATVDGVVEVVARAARDTGEVPATVAVLDRPDGAVTTAMRALGGADLRVFVDGGLTAPLPEGATDLSLDDAVRGVELVVGVLPKSLDELAEIAETVAIEAPRARLVLGARVQHLVRSMNDVLGTSFLSVRGSLGLRKSRALIATQARADAQCTFPRAAHLTDLDLQVRAYGGAFAGATLDIGTRALLEALAAHPESTPPGTVVDLGCGTGILASWAARQWPDAHVIATDRSRAAVRSAAATAAANGVDVEVLRADAAAGVPAHCADVVLLNPPFHEGRAVDPAMANRLFAAAARLLRPGGALVTVFNSHLRHRTHLERLVGDTEQLARTPKFTVTRSVRR